MITYTTTIGYGLHTWDFPIQNIGLFFRVFTAGATFAIIASIWSKTSFALTILRLSQGWMRWFIWFLIILVNVSMGLTALFSFIHCTPVSKTWDITIEGTCWDPKPYLNYNYFSGGNSHPRG